jgi:hypothetical protein
MCTVKQAIHALGGPSAVARAFGFTVQQVCNWSTRGIPARLLLDHPKFFAALKDAGYSRDSATITAEQQAA